MQWTCLLGVMHMCKLKEAISNIFSFLYGEYKPSVTCRNMQCVDLSPQHILVVASTVFCHLAEWLAK